MFRAIYEHEGVLRADVLIAPQLPAKGAIVEPDAY
jgi:hypothetical protein